MMGERQPVDPPDFAVGRRYPEKNGPRDMDTEEENRYILRV
jgi:hypothetical protein